MELIKLRRIRVAIVVMLSILLLVQLGGAIATMASGGGGELISPILTGLTIGALIDIGVIVSVFHHGRIFQKVWLVKAILECIGAMAGFYYAAFERCYNGRGYYNCGYGGPAFGLFLLLGFLISLTVLVLIFHERGNQLLLPARKETNPHTEFMNPSSPPAYDRDSLIV